MKVESAKSLMLLTVVSIALTVLVIPLKIQQDIAYERYIQGLNISGTVVDYPPSWYIWGIGPLVMIMGLFAVISWIFSLSIVINLTIRKNNKSLSGRKSLVALLLIPLLLTIITSGYVYKTTNAVETKSEVLSTDKAFTSTSDTTVNALFAGDEEFMSSSVLWGLGTKPLQKSLNKISFQPIETNLRPNLESISSSVVGLHGIAMMELLTLIGCFKKPSGKLEVHG